MAPPAVLRQSDIVALRRLIAHATAERTDQLRQAAARPIRSAAALREWHDLLLFVRAHPCTDSEWDWAGAELDRVPVHVVGLPERVRHGLLNSGVAGAPVEGCFSLPLVRWLWRQWPGHVVLTQMDASLDEVRDVLRALVLPVERELVDSPVADVDELLVLTFGASRPRWLPLLLARLDALPVSEWLREQWFARLHAYVRVDGSVQSCSVTRARGPTATPHLHPSGLQRDVDVAAVVAQPAPPPVRLSAAAAHTLIDTARTVLATMERETDPITHASAVTLYDMGRGLRIALYSLDVAHRLPFDSYVGFMAFRNGVPLAYGGAWIFPGRSKVGINVFPAQRGGESAWFFAQLLRLYRGVFGVDRFEAENYQLGYGNAEGLRSGAYWFYYRLGFRPTTPTLQRVAAREFARLSRKKGSEVPRRVLLPLVEAGLELTLTASPEPPLDAGTLTAAVSRHIVVHYEGDRQQAITTARKRLQAALRDTLPPRRTLTWSADARFMLDQWLLALDLLHEIKQWSATEKRRLAEVVRTKGEANEMRHQQLLRQHTRLLGAWERGITTEDPRSPSHAVGRQKRRDS